MATDTFLKNPVLIVGTKQEVSATTIQENDLVVVTDERFYTAEEVDDIVGSAEQGIRNDMNTSDSNLQTQITAHDGEITTIKNGLGDLGDQVSDIEEKIPEDASAQNQLVTQNDITNKITNCITEISQDIKLELANGVLTLKAGSKIYSPNGSYSITTADQTISTVTTANGQACLFCAAISGALQNPVIIKRCGSGASVPVDGADYSAFLNTTNLTMNRYANNAWAEWVVALPLAIVTVSDGAISSIDQVFNGFGYIGSTVFVLPGVKGLAPNGRNEDGTLKNIVAQTTSVETLTRSSGATGTKTISLSSSGVPDLPGGMEYNEKENQNYNFDSKSTLGIFGSLDLDSNYRISNFNIKQAFHAVDYNDFASVKDAVPTKQDIATAVNYDNITNCITEIPQDIKLGLGGTKQLYAWTTENDTLYTDTTQAGANRIKVYNANGQDVTSTKGSIYISSDGTYIWCDVATISKHYRDTSNDKTIDYNNSVILKAGSTIYTPNGVGVFDKHTYTSDVTLNISAGVTAKLIVFANGTTKSLAAQAENCFYSGANPTISTSIAIWYDTTENKIKFSDNSGSTWISPYAFPIAKITVSNGEITSINQVFNGFGYIGSTIFALPGVKALIPNGRNPDGSLNNIKTTVSSPKIMTMGSYMAGRNNAPLCLFSNISLGGMDIDANRWGTLKKLQDLPRTANEYSCWHCLEDNFFHYFNVSGVESISQRAFVGSFDVDSNNKITSFTPKTAFYALDKSDTEYIAHQAMPSDRYIDLTLGSSGTSYIAPADGYIILLKKGNYQQYITIDSGYDKVYADYAYNDQVVGLRISVKKGRNYSVWYSASQETQRFAFIYANGSK